MTEIWGPAPTQGHSVPSSVLYTLSSCGLICPFEIFKQGQQQTQVLPGSVSYQGHYQWDRLEVRVSSLVRASSYTAQSLAH